MHTDRKLDHEELFSHAGKISGDLLMTYDNADEVIQMATRNGLSTQTISMKNTHHATMKELIIGHNLAWA
jgi:DNA adenine methylase